MAGKIAPFMDGSQLIIKIDGRAVAFCESLSFNDNMQVQTTFGIGNYGPHTVEPLSYSASGSMRILRYTSESLKYGINPASGAIAAAQPKNIDEVKNRTKNPRGTDGNSMFWLNSFSPLRMMLETTFDIEVYTRKADGTKVLTYVMQDCLVQSIGIGFSPGALVSENISYTCLKITDKRAQQGKPTA